MTAPIDIPSWQYTRANALAALVRTYLTRGMRYGSDVFNPTTSEANYDQGNQAQTIVVPNQPSVQVPGGMLTAYNAELLEAIIAGLALEEPWHEFGNAGEVAFGTNWTNYDAVAYNSCAWKRTALGEYVLKGLAKRTVAGFGVAIVTFPLELRPRRRHVFQTEGNNKFTRIDLHTNGELLIAASDDAAPETHVSLDGIRWRVS